MSVSDKWKKEKRAVKAVQVAFDLSQDVSHQIRYEALRKGINPPDRIREILGLPVSNKPIRPRLSISLSNEDFEILGALFAINPADRLKIRQMAAEKLIEHLNCYRSLASCPDDQN